MLSANVAGRCLEGACEPLGEAACTSDGDCPSSPVPCRGYACVVGVCVRSAREDGARCELASGKPGICESGSCAATGERQRTCRTLWHPYYGPYERCTAGLAFSLSPEKIAETEAALEKTIQDSYRYDLKVALVELPDGGYNFIIYNRRSSEEIRGLCDPSFIAWAVADFTQTTNWKSRILHIWLKPYAEGWGLSTAGGRAAVRHARAGSSLGWLGVLSAPDFRRWLETGFSVKGRPR